MFSTVILLEHSVEYNVPITMYKINILMSFFRIKIDRNITFKTLLINKV